VNVLDTNVGSR